MIKISHPFDIHISGGDSDFLVEEFSESKQFLSDCLATASSASTVACACTVSSAASFSCVGSVISCG